MYILSKDLVKYPNLRIVESLSSMEDVSTLLDTFKAVNEKFGYSRISGVTIDEDGMYHFILDGEGEFNLYSFINSSIIFDIRVSCVNALLVFPLNLSRGMFDIYSIKDEEVAIGDIDEEEELPTGYLDEPLNLDVKYFLVRSSDNTRVEVPINGITVGRSSQRADYVVSGNTNIGRSHCHIYMESGILKVHDCNSLNGTFVNSKRVNPEEDVPLNKGDILFLADEKFIIA